jgi:alcohol-forming fatty acyl-CoA reductase
MAERTLRKTRPAHLPCCILRPSIIAASDKEPFYGWTDTLSAAGGLSVAGASGVLNYINSKIDNIADIIPVDYVSNAIIVSTVMCADKPGLTVVHSNSSHVNPVTWGNYMKYGFDYVTYQPLSTQVFKPKISFV